MPSFDAVNYSLRPNKAVERKIVFDGLARIAPFIDISKFRYIGLGSLWFIDFLIAHRTLGIARMISIERDQIGALRCNFNRPLGCIEVRTGETTQLIPELSLESDPAVVWFDYDSGIYGPTLEDISLLVPRCAANSVIIVTMSAKVSELPSRDENDEPITPEASLRRVAGDLVPSSVGARRLRRSDFPKLLSEILCNAFQSGAISCERREKFVKLFDLAYDDGTPMVTVGGVLAEEENLERIRAAVETDSWAGISDETISIPPLTIKEKMALDRLMPLAAPPSEEDLRELGFALRKPQISAYHRYYRHYPVFGELLW